MKRWFQSVPPEVRQAAYFGMWVTIFLITIIAESFNIDLDSSIETTLRIMTVIGLYMAQSNTNVKG